MTAVFPVTDDARGYIAVAGNAVLAILGQAAVNLEHLDAAEVTRVVIAGILGVGCAGSQEQCEQHARHTRQVNLHCYSPFLTAARCVLRSLWPTRL